MGRNIHSREKNKATQRELKVGGELLFRRYMQGGEGFAFEERGSRREKDGSNLRRKSLARETPFSIGSPKRVMGILSKDFQRKAIFGANRAEEEKKRAFSTGDRRKGEPSAQGRQWPQ